MADEQRDSRGEARPSFFARRQVINSARNGFQLLAGVIKNASLYPAAHPFLLASAEKFIKTIRLLLSDRKEVAFYIIAGELFFETYSVPIDGSLALLIEEFTARDIGGLVFRPGVTAREVISLANILGKDPGFFRDQADLNEAVLNENIEHIDFHRLLLTDKKVAGAVKKGKKKAAQVFSDAIDAVKEIVHAVRLDKTVNARKMNAVVQTMIDSILENRDTFLGLTSIKMYDEYTFAHSVNTAILAVSLGTYLSFEKSQVAALGVASLLHDIGKVSVPIDIINKPGKLSSEEWEFVKRHPIDGALILSDISGITQLAMVAAFEHHQNGASGYPHIEGQKGRHSFSRIVALADAYEALTAARVYYSMQTPPDEAIRILIRKRNTVFEPALVKAFVNMIGLFPVGTVLKLDTGEYAVVEHQTGDLLRPRVLLLDRFDGSEKEAGTRVNLLETVHGRHKRSVVGTVNPYAAGIDVKKYII